MVWDQYRIIMYKEPKIFLKYRGFPVGPVVKNPPANAGDMGSTPDPERSHMRRAN